MRGGGGREHTKILATYTMQTPLLFPTGTPRMYYRSIMIILPNIYIHAIASTGTHTFQQYDAYNFSSHSPDSTYIE